MFALYVALLAAVWLTSFDGAEAQNYTVHSTVIFSRTGDRTPFLQPGPSPQLTSLGAVQMFNLGKFFRQRYVDAGNTGTAGSSAITGLSRSRLNTDQIFVQTLDSEYTATSATAFMQALYPQNQDVTADYADPSSILANNSYVEFPLGGYQYAQINTVGEFDPYSIFIDGTTNCPNFELSALQYYNSAAFNATESQTQTMYQNLGQALLNDVLPPQDWSFQNGYLIYDYIGYVNRHNATAEGVLSGLASNGNVNQFAALAAEKQWQIYGDLSASGIVSGDMIRAVAGQTLAARIMGLLLDNMGSSGASNKFNLLIGEYPAMLSLISLMDLPHSNSNFKYIPPFGSAFAFELFSWQNGTGSSSGDGTDYPADDDLWVRFLYSNGSTTDENPFPSVQAYPLFDRGPSATDMRWVDFESSMEDIMLSDIGEWCFLCGGASIFCPAFLNTTSDSDGSSSDGGGKRVSPAAAGVIGGVITLAIAGLLFAIAACFFGVRVRRDDGRRTADLGGFKGSQKLASDPDLNLPKHSAPMGVFAVGDDSELEKGHERVGSWELENKSKEVERNTFVSLGGSTVASEQHTGTSGAVAAKPSFEADHAEREREGDWDHDDGVVPFQTPTTAREVI